MVIHAFIYSFNKYSARSTYHVSGSVLSARYTVVNKAKAVPVLMKFRNSWGRQTTTKSIKRCNCNMISGKVGNKLGQ